MNKERKEKQINFYIDVCCVLEMAATLASRDNRTVIAVELFSRSRKVQIRGKREILRGLNGKRN